VTDAGRSGLTTEGIDFLEPETGNPAVDRRNRKSGFVSGPQGPVSYGGMKKFEELTEREVLALAIALEEEDERVYADFA
jgi:hypothetical protein